MLGLFLMSNEEYAVLKTVLKRKKKLQKDGNNDRINRMQENRKHIHIGCRQASSLVCLGSFMTFVSSYIEGLGCVKV